MFKKTFKLLAPVSGIAIELNQVPDAVFAGKFAGDGAAIDSTGDTIKAPANGKLNLIFRTNHAFGILLDNGVELLVHIGLDTVHLNGDGFIRIAQEGSRVKAGDPVIRIERKAIESKGYSLITPVLITNMEIISEIVFKPGSTVEAGMDVLCTYKLK